MSKPANYPSQPAHLWNHFYQFTQTPRPSKREEKICDYLLSVASEHGLEHRRDAIGNVVIYVPASKGFEDRPTVTLQNHVDMVTVKTEDKTHDFDNDPLSLKIEDGWLMADRTTLGADNGLGCAAALALMTDPEVEHPALELLFTMDEETGLGGAINLDPSLIKGTKMLNLDTEDWGELFVGCAGGRDWIITKPVTTEAIPAGYTCRRYFLRGLAGGHSGIQIHQQLGNANKLMGQWLFHAEKLGLRLCSMQAGVAHNVIPRSATLEITIPDAQLANLDVLTEKLAARWVSYLPEADANLQISFEAAENTVMQTQNSHKDLRQLLLALPNGAQAYNVDQPADLVDLSITVAVVKVDTEQIFIETSLRYFNSDEAEALADSVISIAETFSAKADQVIAYPGWQPDFSSNLLTHVSDTYERMFGQKPAQKAIHAGLECGIMLDKLDGVEAISFGPTIRGAHSPRERLEITTVAPFWELLKEVVRTL